MRTLILTLISSLLIIPLFGQAPEGINYQAVARDGSGSILKNAPVNLRFTIRESQATGTVVYQEVASSSTNDFGLFSVIIGEGIPLSGTFNAIDWGSQKHFLQVEADPGGGFVDLGTTQLLSVPYAMHAKQADSSLHDSDNQTLSLNDSILSISNGNSVTLPTGVGGVGDDWGSQVVQSDMTLTGDGTTGNPLKLSSMGAQVGQTITWQGNDWYATGFPNPIFSPGAGIAFDNGTINAQTDSALWNADELRGRNISAMSPSIGQVLKWDGSSWAPSDDSAGTGYWRFSTGWIVHDEWNVSIGTQNSSANLNIVGSLRIFDPNSTNLDMHFIENNSGDLRFRPYGTATPSITIRDDRDYIGMFGNTPITPASYLDLTADEPGSDYGGMFINTTSDTGRPFYGYATGGVDRAWTYYDGPTSSFRVLIDNSVKLSIGENGKVGIGTTSPISEFEVVADDLPQGELASFEVDDINPNNDVLNMEVQFGAPDNAQFIEMRRGNALVAAIHTDGSAEFEDIRLDNILGNNDAPQKGGIYANSMPLAYGYINSAGGINQSYGITSVTKQGTGNYHIQIDQQMAGAAVMIATIDANPSQPSQYFNAGRYATTNKISWNTVAVRTWQLGVLGATVVSGSPIDHGFSFVVFGKPD